MISVNRSGYFITGSDTDVGKTYIACELIRQLRQLKLELEVRKPVESGCFLDESGRLIANDALKLQAANENCETVETIAPYRFKAALAPPRAARLEGSHLYTADLLAACALDNRDHSLIVEGAGGFYSPLSEDGLNADLASLLQLPVIIVVNDRIGAVNQALMTIQAVESRHLSIAVVIMNQVDKPENNDMDNVADLKVHSAYPVFRCKHQQCLEPLFEVTSAQP
ncbi:MAG: dethiobiotin synthase [Gammaproteobacteria bacterium]